MYSCKVLNIIYIYNRELYNYQPQVSYTKIYKNQILITSYTCNNKNKKGITVEISRGGGGQKLVSNDMFDIRTE